MNVKIKLILVGVIMIMIAITFGAIVGFNYGKAQGIHQEYKNLTSVSAINALADKAVYYYTANLSNWQIVGSYWKCYYNGNVVGIGVQSYLPRPLNINGTEQNWSEGAIYNSTLVFLAKNASVPLSNTSTNFIGCSLNSTKSTANRLR